MVELKNKYFNKHSPEYTQLNRNCETEVFLLKLKVEESFPDFSFSFWGDCFSYNKNLLKCLEAENELTLHLRRWWTDRLVDQFSHNLWNNVYRHLTQAYNVKKNKASDYAHNICKEFEEKFS